MIIPFAIAAILHQTAKPVSCRWRDEFDHPSEWKHIAASNKPSLDWSRPGKLGLTLPHVPRDWPYQYQWAALTKTVTLDMTAAPFLTARVTELKGYAHLDIDFMSNDKVLSQLRSSTIESPGVMWLDMSDRVFPGTYTFRIRIVAGGPNEGCNAMYDWLRLTSVEDGKRLLADPNVLTVTGPPSH